MKTLKKNKGITLVALVVTIVILLILAGISINMVLGENGIVRRANEARSRTRITSDEEAVQMAVFGIMLDGDLSLDKLQTELNKTRPGEFSISEADGIITVSFNGGKSYTVDKTTGEVALAGPSVRVGNIKLVKIEGGVATEVTPNQIEEGEELYLQFKPEIEDGTIEYVKYNGTESLTPDANGIYSKAITTNGTYSFDILGKIGDEEYPANSYPINVTGYKVALAEYKQDSMLEKTTNTTIQVAYKTGTTPVTIPAKYKVAADSGKNADEGIVIVDRSGNEWVWVPVSSSSSLYTASVAGDAEADPPVAATNKLSGSTGATTTKYSKSGIVNGYSITRSYPGDTSKYREPDLVTSKDNNTRAISAGFKSLSNMAETMVSEYNQMIASIEEYKGFWIGRYELSGTTSSPKVQKGTSDTDLPIGNTNWYDLYKACKSLSADNTKAITRMIWGCQWDATCNYIAEGGTYSIKNPTPWGNYNDYNTENNYTEGSEKYEAKAGSKAPAGTSENWKAKNIYDFAGNMSEWTQEAYSTTYRADRGGYYSIGGGGGPAAHRFSSYPNNTIYAYIRVSPYFNSITNWELGETKQCRWGQAQMIQF